MKRLLLAALLLLAPATPALAGACFVPRPFCPYPSQAMCVCSGGGSNCYWICAQP